MAEFKKLHEARAQLGDLVNKAAFQGEPTVITRNNKPAAVLVSVDDYNFLVAQKLRLDLTSIGPSETMLHPGAPVAEPQRIAAEYRPGEPPTRPGFRS